MRTFVRNVAFVVAMGLIGGTAWAQRVDGGVRLNGAMQGTPLNNPIFTGQWTVNTVLCAAGTVLQGGSPTTCTATPTITAINSTATVYLENSLFTNTTGCPGCGFPLSAYARIDAYDNTQGGLQIGSMANSITNPGMRFVAIDGQQVGMGNQVTAPIFQFTVASGNAGGGVIGSSGYLYEFTNLGLTDLSQWCFTTEAAITSCTTDYGGGTPDRYLFDWSLKANSMIRSPRFSFGSGGSTMLSPSNGLVQLVNQAQTSFTRLILGANDATTNGASWNMNGGVLEAKTGDATAFAGVKAGTINGTRIQVNGVDVVNAQPCFNTAASTDITGTNTKTYFSVSCKIPAGSLNTAGDAVKLSMRGLYSGNVTDTMTMTLEACQVQGCASGTKVTVHTAAAITLTAVSNQGFELDTQIVSFTTGAAGGHDAQGKIFYELTGTTATPDWLPNTATIAWDDTVDEYLTMSVTFSTNSGNNHASIRNLVGTIQ